MLHFKSPTESLYITQVTFFLKSTCFFLIIDFIITGMEVEKMFVGQNLKFRFFFLSVLS